MFVQQSFQLRLGLLCLLLVPVLVGRRGGRQRGVCVGCRRILLKDMRVVAFVFFLFRFFACVARVVWQWCPFSFSMAAGMFLFYAIVTVRTL